MAHKARFKINWCCFARASFSWFKKLVSAVVSFVHLQIFYVIMNAYTLLGIYLSDCSAI